MQTPGQTLGQEASLHDAAYFFRLAREFMQDNTLDVVETSKTPHPKL